jgi:tRNA dimethylallyltransferase
LSLKIAKDVFEIISSDSVQVYRYLDVGSGKPSAEDRNKVKHYLIDIVNPDAGFTAGDFCREAEKVCAEIREKGRLPLFVGGTGFYLDSFFKGLSNIPYINSAIKAGLQKELLEQGLDSLYNELLRQDPVFAKKIHSHDKQRILRGLEVYRGTGRPLSSFFGSKEGRQSEDTLHIGLLIDKIELYRRIENRIDSMIENGLLEEVKRIRQMGYGPELNSMKTIGYAQINDVIDGRLGLEEAILKIKSETKKYAKRQMTWFNKNKNIAWFEYFQVEKIEKYIYDWQGKI